MSWVLETFIDELSNGAVKDFISNSVDDTWIVQRYGSIDKCVEITQTEIAEDDIVAECIDEILSIILTKILERDNAKEY